MYYLYTQENIDKKVTVNFFFAKRKKVLEFLR